MGEILMFHIFPIVDMCLNCKDIAEQICQMCLRHHDVNTLFTVRLLLNYGHPM